MKNSEISALSLPAKHRLLAERGRWSSYAAFERYFAELFSGVNFTGRRVLDVGGGIGTCSFLAALGGATDVLCLDPEEDGATAGTGATFRELVRALDVENTRIEPATLQSLEAPAARFDVVVLHNSINHLDEQACIDYQRSEQARNSYRACFEKLAHITAPGGDLVIADCTSRNLFPLLGFRHPISRSIEWEKHQPPEVWAEALQRVGFERPEIRWTSYSRLGRLGWTLTANRWAAFLLTGHFVLRMKRSR